MRKKIINVIFIFLCCLAFVFLGDMFRLVCDNLMEAHLWWLSTVIALIGVYIFFSPIDRNIKKKHFKIALICGSIFTVIGLTMLIVCSFLFIKELRISISLSVCFVAICGVSILLPICLDANGKTDEHDNLK